MSRLLPDGQPLSRPDRNAGYKPQSWDAAVEGWLSVSVAPKNSLFFTQKLNRAASNELRKRGIFISSSGVRLVWLRHQLTRFKDRLKALEMKMTDEDLILTEAQVQALEKKKNDDLVSGEIETAHPG